MVLVSHIFRACRRWVRLEKCVELLKRSSLVEAHLGNLGIRSGQQIQRFLVALRSYRAPLRVLDLHRNCLLPPMGEDMADPQV